MHLKKAYFCLSTVLLLLLPISQSYAKPHVHGARTHTHGLPAQGYAHRHNKGLAGRPIARKTIKKAPTKTTRRIVRQTKPFNEAAYTRYKRCVSWRKKVRDYGDDIDALDRKIKSSNRSLDKITDKRRSAKNWMSIQKAAGDVDGHNRNVRKFNSLGRKGRRIESRMNDRIDSRNSKVRRMNSFIRDIKRDCKSFPRSVVKKGCDNGYRSAMCSKL